MTAFSDPPRRYLHLWLDRLSIDRTRRAHPALTSPLCLTAKQASALRIQALDPAGLALGLVCGMSLASARAQVPHLLAADADPDADAALLATVAKACRRYTPSLAQDPPDGIVLNITGTGRLFGGEAALAWDLTKRMRREGLSARCGIADTPALAFALARYAADPIAPPGAGAEALASLPMAALRLEPETLERLFGLGLKRVGQILDAAARPALARRLGEAVLVRLDEALGVRSTALSLELEISPWRAERRLAEPMAETDQVLRLIAELAAELCERLEAERKGARLFTLELFRVDGAVKRLEVAASLPLREPKRVAALFVERIAALNEGLEADFGFDQLRLWARAGEAATVVNADLLRDDDPEAGFSALVDRLSARLGRGTVRRLTPALETRLPERAVRAPAFDAACSAGWAALPAPVDEGTPLRPLTLFAPPQPIEVLAVAPEGAPDRFQWRRVHRRIVAAEGPERLEPEWGRQAEAIRVRDYYRVEDDLGRRYWLFREGRYDDGGADPRWFIHGLLA